MVFSGNDLGDPGRESQVDDASVSSLPPGTGHCMKSAPILGVITMLPALRPIQTVFANVGMRDRP